MSDSYKQTDTTLDNYRWITQYEIRMRNVTQYEIRMRNVALLTPDVLTKDYETVYLLVVPEDTIDTDRKAYLDKTMAVYDALWKVLGSTHNIVLRTWSLDTPCFNFPCIDCARGIHKEGDPH